MIVHILSQLRRPCSYDGNGLVETWNDTGDNPAIHQRNRMSFSTYNCPRIANM